MTDASTPDGGPSARWFSAHEPDVCRARLDAVTGVVVDPADLAAGVVEERGWRPQLKEKGDQLRIRPPRKLGGALTLVTLMVRMRRDDGGGTIIEVRRRRPWWGWIISAPPLLLGLVLAAVAVGDQLWGLVPVAAVAVALGAMLPGLLLRAGDPEVLKLADFIATTCDAISLDEEVTS